jgi:spermidine/putrescine transport system substrate-binding protein
VLPASATQIPNLKHIDRDWRARYAEADGYAVPYAWGTVGVAYRRDQVQTPPQRWLDVLKPAPELHGRLAMYGSQREILGVALKSQGYSVNSAERPQIERAIELLLEQKPHVASYGTPILTEQSELVTGQVSVATMYSGDALTLKEYNDNIEFVVPAEGAIVWADYLAVLAGTRHPELAYAFIDFLNEPRNAARLAAFINCSTPNRAALALLPPAYRNNRLIMPDPATLARSELLTSLAPRVMSFRNTQFARLLH